MYILTETALNLWIALGNMAILTVSILLLQEHRISWVCHFLTGYLGIHYLTSLNFNIFIKIQEKLAQCFRVVMVKYMYEKYLSSGWDKLGDNQPGLLLFFVRLQILLRLKASGRGRPELRIPTLSKVSSVRAYVERQGKKKT